MKKVFSLLLSLTMVMALLAGIPSVVYGLVGMILLVPAIRVAFDPDMELIGLSAGLQKSSWSLSNLVNNFTGLFRGD